MHSPTIDLHALVVELLLRGGEPAERVPYFSLVPVEPHVFGKPLVVTTTQASHIAHLGVAKDRRAFRFAIRRNFLGAPRPVRLVYFEYNTNIAVRRYLLCTTSFFGLSAIVLPMLSTAVRI